MRPAWIGLVALLALVSGSTCRKAQDHRASMDEPVTLKQGQWVSFAGRPLEIAFLRVLQDSRCPRNVQCIRQGDAVILLQAKSPDGGFDTIEARLPGNVAPTDTTVPWDVWGGYRFRLLQLDPYPVAGVEVDSSAYVATLLVRPS